MDSVQKYWWEEDEEIHAAVWDVVNALKKNQTFRSQANLRHMRLYAALDLLGLAAGAYAQNSNNEGVGSRLKFNIIQSAVDTLVSKITKNRPKPTFITDGGNFSQQTKAKKLQKFMDGVFYESNMYDLGTRIFRDSLVFGTGAAKFFIKNGKICVERAFIEEIVIDDAEGIYGQPRQLHQKKVVPREVLKRMFPDHAGMIDLVNRSSASFFNHAQVMDQVDVVESWHLPSGEDAGDGKHVICIENATLFEEEWKLDCFPFVFLKWTDRLLGFFGQGLVEQLTGIQLEINKLLRTIQYAMHFAVPRVFLQQGSGVPKAHLNNEIGAIVTYQGTPPIIANNNMVPPELREHLQYLVQSAYEIAGISMLSAQSKKPGGLDSGVALREYNDIETERFMSTGRQYEQFYMDAARLSVKLIKDMVESEDEDLADYEVRVDGDRGMEKIKWSQIKMDEDDYVMKVFPTNFLPSTPSGKLEKVQELIEMQLIDREDALQLLEFPDLEAVSSLSTAAVREINRMIELMVEDGKYTSPEPFQNLELGIRKVQAAYLKAKMDNVPEERLELLRRWMTQAQGILHPEEEMAPPMPEEGMPMEGEMPMEGMPMQGMPPEMSGMPLPEGGQGGF